MTAIRTCIVAITYSSVQLFVRVLFGGPFNKRICATKPYLSFGRSVLHTQAGACSFVLNRKESRASRETGAIAKRRGNVEGPGDGGDPRAVSIDRAIGAFNVQSSWTGRLVFRCLRHSFAQYQFFTYGEDLLIVGKNKLTHCEITGPRTIHLPIMYPGG